MSDSIDDYLTALEALLDESQAVFNRVAEAIRTGEETIRRSKEALGAAQATLDTLRAKLPSRHIA